MAIDTSRIAIALLNLLIKENGRCIIPVHGMRQFHKKGWKLKKIFLLKSDDDVHDVTVSSSSPASSFRGVRMSGRFVAIITVTTPSEKKACH